MDSSRTQHVVTGGKNLCALAWLFMTLSGVAQTDTGEVDLLLKGQLAVTSSRITHPKDVIGWSSTLQPDARWHAPSRQQAYWIKLDAASIPTKGVIWIPGQALVNLWMAGQADTITFSFGLYQPLHKLPLYGQPDAMPVDQIQETTEELIFRIRPFSQQPYPVRVSSLTPADHTRLRDTAKMRKPGYHLFLGAGVLSLIFLAGFAMFQFLENRKKAYLYYGLYMLCMAFYFGRLLEYHFGVAIFWGFFYEGYGLAEILALMLSYVMYVQFARYFLELDARRPGLLIFVRIWTALGLAIGVIGLLLSLFYISSPLFLQVYIGVRFLMPVLVVLFLWRIAQARLPFSRFVLLGTFFLLLGGIVALGETFIFQNMRGALLHEPFFFMLTGVLLESFAFALGLGKQARQTELDKIATQQQLIIQLQKEAKLERDIRESQVQTLRAQMNPHFIFNALNSIQHFILDNQKENSVKYLSRVSQLIRRVLQNSTTPNILLDEELQTLKAYVEIEQLRFHAAFTFTCTVDEEVPTEILRIPHLMIQPFIENAILHGLVHLKGNGILTLQVRPYREDEAIEVIITDNGIGREEAAKRSKQSPRKHNSISTGSIEARIRLLLPDEQQPVLIEDLKDENGRAAGTRVRLTIPIV
ncbi:MAG TPA: histidine kinase [Saprospiraceae bacterium]|nr:histidine kinase [Saprospiraceae bacterium]